MGVLFKYGRRFYFAPSFNNKTIGTKMLEVCNQKKKCNNLNLFALIKIVVVNQTTYVKNSLQFDMGFSM